MWLGAIGLCIGLAVALNRLFPGSASDADTADIVRTVALLALVEHLRAHKFALLDTQWLTPHLAQFGAIELPRDHYLKLLTRAVELPRKF